MHHLKECADQHVQFQYEYARALNEMQKHPENTLQTSAQKTGRKHTLDVEHAEEKRRIAIESGRAKKRVVKRQKKNKNDTL
jgi:ABC-type nitrate/sulfonate/bicarbonate transport system substrate-binding protein